MPAPPMGSLVPASSTCPSMLPRRSGSSRSFSQPRTARKEVRTNRTAVRGSMERRQGAPGQREEVEETQRCAASADGFAEVDLNVEPGGAGDVEPGLDRIAGLDAEADGGEGIGAARRRRKR